MKKRGRCIEKCMDRSKEIHRTLYISRCNMAALYISVCANQCWEFLLRVAFLTKWGYLMLCSHICSVVEWWPICCDVALTIWWQFNTRQVGNKFTPIERNERKFVAIFQVYFNNNNNNYYYNFNWTLFKLSSNQNLSIKFSYGLFVFRLHRQICYCKHIQTNNNRF